MIGKEIIFSAFRCPVKIPEVVLKSASIAAINFHPAPPNYRGSGSCLAIYDQISEFGCTAHIMENRIDTGQILCCRRFSISENETLPELWQKANEHTFKMAMVFISGICSHGEDYIDRKKTEFKSELWSGPLRTLKEIDALQCLDAEITEEELLRIIRATSFDKYKPYIYLHGHKFVCQK